MPIPVDAIKTLAKSAEGLISSIPKRDHEAQIIRAYLNAVRRHHALLAKAKRNAKKRALKGMAHRQAERAKKWEAIAEEHYPLVKAILVGCQEKATPKEFVEALFSEDEGE